MVETLNTARADATSKSELPIQRTKNISFDNLQQEMRIHSDNMVANLAMSECGTVRHAHSCHQSFTAVSYSNPEIAT